MKFVLMDKRSMRNFRCNISYNIFYSNRILRVNKAMKFIKFKAYRYYIKEKTREVIKIINLK